MRSMPKTINRLLLPLLLALAGCAPTVLEVTTDKNKPVVEQALAQPPVGPSPSGSIWSGGGMALFADSKARRVGDLVTVLVVEQASATRKLGDKRNKTSSHNTGLNALLGFEKSIAARNQNFTPGVAMDITDQKLFSGTGETNNSDTLTASVTAVVTKLYPNGNMEIIGRREVTVNHEPQELTFVGIIRPMDIAADNSIPSAKVAQARISYGGGGGLASTVSEGWLSRSLDAIWPF